MISPLSRLIADLIGLEGPISLQTYMGLALAHPEHGYYRRRDPIGSAGDFITAPEISQMFGELIGLFIGDLWQRNGAPQPARLIELGPGRGTLMADMLRALKIVPGATAALNVNLVETSSVLRARQAKTIADPNIGIAWYDTVDAIPTDMPAFVIANEFFDALPIRQFEKRTGNWFERCVALDPKGGFILATHGAPIDPRMIPKQLAGARDGAVFESCGPAAAIMSAIAARLTSCGGAALVIDYGYDGPATGDTLQAMRDHARADILDAPGDVDLTTHVDFTALATAARDHGCRVFGPIGQGAFLEALGIRLRADKLRTANPARTVDIEAALKRLVGPQSVGPQSVGPQSVAPQSMTPQSMGNLFRVMCMTPKNAPQPAGFASLPVFL